MTSYYNEIDPYAAEWLRNLIKAGLIPDGEVDTRSIVDVSADDLRGFTQCHFFAGIGGWAHALRLAEWPDDRPIWTGSCPCQPFSVAGKQLGTDDPRHLWPHFFRLIRASRPPVVMGEQVAGAAGYGWFDGVAADLEAENYISRAVDIPACSVDAPHIRSRLYWVASDMGNADRAGGASRIVVASGAEARSGQSVGSGVRSDVADAKHCAGGQFNGDPREVAGPQGSSEGKEPEARGSTQTSRHSRSRGHGDVADAQVIGREEREWKDGQQNAGSCGKSGMDIAGVDEGHMADADSPAKQRGWRELSATQGQEAGWSDNGSRGAGSFWANAIWLTGSDGKARRAEPTIPLLAHGIPARVGRLRAYGNAIVPQVAAEVIRAYMDMEA